MSHHTALARLAELEGNRLRLLPGEGKSKTKNSSNRQECAFGHETIHKRNSASASEILRRSRRHEKATEAVLGSFSFSPL